MRVTVEYTDNNSLVPEEITHNNEEYFGLGSRVTVGPSYDTPIGHIYFGIQGLMTQKQIELYHDSGALYNTKLAELRLEVLNKLENELNKVIIHNEEKLG